MRRQDVNSVRFRCLTSKLQGAATDYPNINSHRVEGAFVKLWRTGHGWHEAALHRPVADDNESNARVKLTTEHTRLGPCRRLGRSRTGECNQRCTESQRLRIHDSALPASSVSKSIIDAAAEGVELVSAYTRADHLGVKIFTLQGPVRRETIFHTQAGNDARTPG